MTARTWIVDAANVVGARPNGWWRDRAGAAATLHRRIQRSLTTATNPPTEAADATHAAVAPVIAALGGFPERVVLVLEGAARAGVTAGTGFPASDDGAPRPEMPSLTVVHANGSGDDAIVAAAATAKPPVLVFTSDRALRGRLVAGGAHVRGSGGLWELLDAVSAGGPDEGPQTASSGP
jgi:hypothetical protein